MEILNEIYFGKKKKLLAIEDDFMKVQKKYAKCDLYHEYKYFKQLNADPALRDIENEIIECFGFNAVTVSFGRDPSINAYTIPFVVDEQTEQYYDVNDNAHGLDQLRKATIVTSSGFKFDKKKFPVNLLVCITLGCIFRPKNATGPKATIPELVAVLLHEIGHTFSLSTFGSGANVARTNEKFADNFAAMYGYSEEIISFFNKLRINYGKIGSIVKDIPVANIVLGLGKITADGLFRLFNNPDEHPALVTRVRYQIKQLESDLRYTPNINAKMKLEIQRQINACKAAIQKFEHNSDNNSDRIIKAYQRNIQTKIPGEAYINAKTEQYASSDKINKNILKMYKNYKEESRR